MFERARARPSNPGSSMLTIRSRLSPPVLYSDSLTPEQVCQYAVAHVLRLASMEPAVRAPRKRGPSTKLADPSNAAEHEISAHRKLAHDAARSRDRTHSAASSLTGPEPETRPSPALSSRVEPSTSSTPAKRTADDAFRDQAKTYVRGEATEMSRTSTLSEYLMFNSRLPYSAAFPMTY